MFDMMGSIGVIGVGMIGVFGVGAVFAVGVFVGVGFGFINVLSVWSVSVSL